MAEVLQQVIEEQKAYYQARAQEYDEWFYRRGRYDHGPAHTQQWQAEAEEVRQGLAGVNFTGQVLDIAAGTGIWTQELLKTAEHVTALDSSAEMLELNRQRVQQSNKVTYTVTDLFYWQPVMLYDAIFLGFWLSHVPPSLLYDFIGTIVGALKPGGKLFFVDSLPDPSSTSEDMVDYLKESLDKRSAANQPGSTDVIMTRRLNDGREFQVVKIFYRPDNLIEQFKAHNVPITVKQSAHYFLYGWGIKPSER